MNGKMKTQLIGIAFFAIGAGLVWVFSNGWVMLGVICMIWAHNLEYHV